MTVSAHLLREEAYRLGFDYVGFSRAEELTEEGRRLETWLNQGFHGKMAWMENHFEMRIDPRKLVPGAKSVATFLFNYAPHDTQHDPDAPKLAKYAYGEDYHHVIKDKLRQLMDHLRTEVGDIEGRCFVDSAPVLEREWAKRGGLGWLGKNTLLINRQRGSFYFLAVLISDLDFDTYDGPIKDYCGRCTRCIDACPTEAIHPDGYLLDASKCISYLTIELREAIPDSFKNQMEGWAFGCDICQDVCPWNRFAQPHQEPAFMPHPDLLDMDKRDWQEMTEAFFQDVFRKSAVKRVKWEGLKRNLRFLDGENTTQGD